MGSICFEVREMNPQVFYEKMKRLRGDNDDYDKELTHDAMDNLMCEVLTELGYEDGVKVFQETDKWYA